MYFVCGLILGLVLATCYSAYSFRQDNPRDLMEDADFWYLQNMQRERQMEQLEQQNWVQRRPCD